MIAASGDFFRSTQLQASERPGSFSERGKLMEDIANPRETNNGSQTLPLIVIVGDCGWN
jgi:hypothetical protein